MLTPPEPGEGLGTALPPPPLAATSASLGLIPGAPKLVESREGKSPGESTKVGLSCPREMQKLELSAGPFWCYRCNHLNKLNLTKLACSIGLKTGAELPWQRLCAARCWLGKAIQRLHETLR